jgi:hypothetical protein
MLAEQRQLVHNLQRRNPRDWLGNEEVKEEKHRKSLFHFHFEHTRSGKGPGVEKPG